MALPTFDPSRAEQEAAERVLARLLTTVFWSLADSKRAGHTLAQAQAQLEQRLQAAYGIDNQTLVALMAQEALRRIDLGRDD